MRADTAEAHLRYYLAELAYLQSAGAAFAQRYPNVAARLDWGGHGSADPHVERLLESFAFLTARLQRNIDRQLPSVAQAMLETLYPQLVAPVPSMAIAQFLADPNQSRSVAGYTLPAALPMFAPASDGAVVWWRTAFPVTLWPLEIGSADFVAPGAYAFLDDRPAVAAALRLRLRCQGQRNFAEFRPRRLRVYLHAPVATAALLYEMLTNGTLEVALVNSEAIDSGDCGRILGRPVLLPAACVRPVGFSANEAILPYPPTAHAGYRLLQEYFAFPQKFLMLDVDGLDAPGGLGSGRYADLLFLLAEKPRDGLFIEPSTFCLGCTPIINLFRRTAEPLRIDETQLEYRLVADAFRERTTEIHSILDVTSTAAERVDTRRIRPYFSYSHEDAVTGQQAFWLARREPTVRPDQSGTDMVMSFVDLGFSPAQPATQVAFAHVLCTNRGLAEQMPAGTPLQIEVDAPIAGAQCLIKPTRQVAAPVQGESLWRLVSHLSLNQLSLVGGADGLAALREILRLYAGPPAAATEAQILGLVDVAARHVVRRVGVDAWRGFCRGTEVTIGVDETQFVGSGAYLFSAVLSRFFGLYTAVNSFTQLVLISRQREGLWKTWPPLSGEAAVL